MLKRIRLMDFKSFVDEEVELAPLTLLVGANASGKSNFLDSIRFLQGIYSDLTLAEVLNGEESSRPDAWPGIRGRAQEAARIPAREFTLESTWSTPQFARRPDLRQTYEVIHSITCQTEPSVRLKEESFSSLHQADIFKFEENGLFTPSGRLQPSNLTLAKSLLGQELEPRMEHLQQLTGLVFHRIALKYHLHRIQFLELVPDQMRDYGRRGAPLGSEGKNLSGVLADLCEDPDDKQSLIEWLSELLAPELQDIDFGGDRELGDVMAILVERGGHRISARSISDGTLLFLGILLALRTAEAGSTILVEEIGDGLHSTRIKLLVEYLEAVTRAREIQVIATTHSPVVLEWLSDEALRNVVVFGRVPDHEGTLMRRLADLPHFDETVARTGIEELFTTGWLEMAL